MSEKLIRGKAVKGDKVYGYYSFPQQRPMHELIAELDKLFERGALAIAWEQTHGVWNDSTYSDFELGDMMVTKDPAIAAYWVDNTFHNYDGEYYDDDDFFPGHGHRDGLTIEDFPDVLTEEFEHAAIEHFGKNAQIVVTPEDVYRFDYEGGY